MTILTPEMATALALRPPPPMTVDQHAELTLYLSEKTSAIAGLINLDHTPYLRLPLQLFTHPDVVWIDLMAGTQIGKTILLFCILNYIVDHAPGPTMYNMPTKDIGQEISKSRIQPLFLDCPNLRKHLTGNKNDFNLLTYTLRTCTIRYSWNSLASVSSHPEKYLIKDEVKDTDPMIVEAAEDRTKTFFNRKIISASSPRVWGDNITTPMGIERDHDLEAHVKVTQPAKGQAITLPVRRFKPKDGRSSTYYTYHVHCPHCKAPQQLHGDLIRWPRDCAIADLTHTAWYQCEHCQGKILDRHKPKMVRAGHWHTDTPFTQRHGFWLPSYYSTLGPACTFGEIAAGYIRAWRSKDPERMEAFVNGYMAIPYEEEEFGDDAFDLSGLIQAHPTTYARNTLPPGTAVIFTGVDVHKRHLRTTVLGWAPAHEDDHIGEPYLIAWHMEPIDMDHAPQEARDYIKRLRQIPYTDGTRTLYSIATGIDSAYSTEQVYTWCRDITWLIPLRGQRGEVRVPEGMEATVTSTKAIDKLPSGKTLPEGSVTLQNLNTGYLKRELYTAVNAGTYHVPHDVDQAYLAELNSEKRVTRRGRNGQLTTYYIPKNTGQQNHYLDTTIYATATKAILTSGLTLAQAAAKYYPSPKQPKKPMRSAQL